MEKDWWTLVFSWVRLLHVGSGLLSVSLPNKQKNDQVIHFPQNNDGKLNKSSIVTNECTIIAH